MDLYLVEWSRREDDPWNPDVIFGTKEEAEEYVKENEDSGFFLIEEVPARGKLSLTKIV